MNTSTTHLVLIPSYNTGAKVYDTVRAARAGHQPLLVKLNENLHKESRRGDAVLVGDLRQRHRLHIGDGTAQQPDALGAVTRDPQQELGPVGAPGLQPEG